MKERIRQIIHDENLTSAQFASEIGVQASGLSHILSGRNNPGLDFIQKLLKKYDYINAQWLLTGEGEKNKNNRETGGQTLFDNNESSINTEKSTDVNTKKTIFSDKTIEKIVVFYSDHTFKEYRQS